MSDVPGLPDLTKLTSDEKDQLIASLYATLLAMEGHAPPSTAPVAAEDDAAKTDTTETDTKAKAGVGDLRSRIASSAPSRRSTMDRGPAPGAVARLLGSRLLQILLVVLGIVLAADFATGWYERDQLVRQQRAAAELRSAAFDGLYAELIRVAYEPDGRGYRATMTMQNAHRDVPLYVMMSPMRVFVQVGLAWQEVPAEAPPGQGWGVVRLDESRDVSVVFQADLKGWRELIPGYMHVRIDSQMLISRSATPTSDIVERNNVFYVYLKPQGADDEAIKRKARFPGKPPVFIPMPPH